MSSVNAANASAGSTSTVTVTATRSPSITPQGLHRSCLDVARVRAGADVRYTSRVKLGLVAMLVASTAHADSRLIDDDTFAVREPGPLGVDAGLIVALPSALPSGMATGIGGGVTHACGCVLAYGARAAFA